MKNIDEQVRIQCRSIIGPEITGIVFSRVQRWPQQSKSRRRVEISDGR
jgi:hypothetical protein